MTHHTVREAARLDPRLLVLRTVEELETSLERNTRNVPSDGQFHVRVRGRIVFSGSYAASQARYERARDAQLWRKLSTGHRATRLCRLPSATTVRQIVSASRSNGRYAGQRRTGWRALFPLPSDRLEKG